VLAAAMVAGMGNSAFHPADFVGFPVIIFDVETVYGRCCRACGAARLR
jgi:hypothetical protein